MKSRFSAWVLLTALLTLLSARRAFAGDPSEGGTDGDVAVEGGAPSDDGGQAAEDASDEAPGPILALNGNPLRCDGALCDTTTGGVPCSIAEPVGSRGHAPSISVALLIGAVGLGSLRRRARGAKERAQ
jgi:hypothetical protein